MSQARSSSSASVSSGFEERGVVLGVREVRRAPGAEEAAVGVAQLAQQERRVRARREHPVVAVERDGGFGERGEEERVPPEEHLVVELRADALLAAFEERAEVPGHRRRHRLVAVGDVQDAAAEVRVRVDEVPGFGDAEVAHHLVGVVAAHLADLGRRPEVELAFDALGVGVLGGVEAARRIGEVAQHVADDVFDHRPVARLAGDQIAVQVRA